MAIKFSQFVVETSASTMSHIVGYDGADNIQITPNNFFTSFVTGTAGQVPFFGSTTSLLGDAGFNWDNTNKRLGIGTSSPIAPLTITTQMAANLTSTLYLDVEGSNLNGGGGQIVFNTSATSGNLTNYNAKVTGTRVPGDGGDSELGFWTTLVSDNVASQQRMTITSAGNVGIGTTSPGTTLDVVGTLASSGITQLGTGGSNVLLTSASAGNVGIGTASPAYKLHTKGTVNGNVNIAVENDSTGTNAYSSYRFKNDSIDTAVMFLNGSNNTGYAGASSLNMYQGTSLPLGFVTNNLLRMIVAGDGNVGIGTSTPGYSLEVRGNADQSLYLAKTGTTYLRATASANAELFTGGSMVLGSGNAERMRIDSSGNVGIGTTNPAQKLDVLGNVRSAHDANNYMQLESNSGGGVLSGKSSGTVTTLVRTYGNSYFNGGNFGIGTSSPTQKLDVRKNQAGYTYIASDNANTAASGTGSGFAMTEGGSVAWYLRNERDGSGKFNIGNSANRLTIDSSGNVGIGTTSPVSSLNITTTKTVALDTAAKFLTLGLTVDDLTAGNTAGGGGGIAFRSKNDNSGTQVVFGAIDAIKESANVSDFKGALRFFTNQNSTGVPLERMRIDSSGNVGIGTSSPSSLLSVGNAATHDNPSTTVNIATTDTGSYLLKVTSDQFNSDGNWVGIGLGYSNNYMKMGIIAEAKDSNARGKLHFAVNTAAGSSNASISDAKMTIDNAGKVGIGTTTPGSKLEVVGEIRASEGSDYSSISTSGGDTIFGNISTAANNIRIFNGGAERMRIDSSGNVGIGTSTPTAKLTVVGLAEHADNSAAISAGLTTGAFYRTGDLLKVVH